MLLVGRQLLAGSPGQAQPGGGQRAQLEGAPRQSLSELGLVARAGRQSLFPGTLPQGSLEAALPAR